MNDISYNKVSKINEIWPMSFPKYNQKFIKGIPIHATITMKDTHITSHNTTQHTTHHTNCRLFQPLLSVEQSDAALSKSALKVIFNFIQNLAEFK